jgi:tetratricopeptide (TPR) repeat protein
MSVAEEREFLLRSLRDLEAERAAGDIGEADYVALRDDYTARAAALLRDQEAVAAAGEPSPSRSPGRGRARSAAVVIGMLVTAGVAGWAVAQSSGERVAGDVATGEIEQASTDRITRAQQLVSEGKLLDAIKTYDALLSDDPDNPVALAERGWLISRVDPSLVDKGLASIDRAIAVAPTYPQAHFYRGMILLQSKGDAAGAAASFDRALASDPPPDLVEYLRDARDRAVAAAAGTTTAVSG